MTVRWTQPAQDDFLGVIEWIVAGNPAAAAKVGRRILASLERLARYRTGADPVYQRSTWPGVAPVYLASS
jgi:plasmid stabilization system protein ParE